MGGVSPGSITNRMPPAEDDQARRARDLARSQREQASARSLESTSIGEGGLRVIGGSIDIEAGGELNVDGDATFNGNLTVPAGSLNTAGSISAGANVTAGGTVQGGSVVSTGGGSVSGSLSVGSLSSGGPVSGSSVTGVDVYAQSLGTNITAARVALWGRTSDGYIATATSSERFKTNVRPSAQRDPRVLLEVVVSYFEYIDEVRKRDDPTFEHYVGPEYHVGTNIGAIAERLHELGLWEYVVYEREPITDWRVVWDVENAEVEATEVVVGDQLKVDAAGEPTPYGIHDMLLVYEVIRLAQWQNRRMDRLAARLRALDGIDEPVAWDEF